MKEAEYKELLERIERENPQEPLLSTLQRGYSRVNAIFMVSAAKRLLKEVEEAEAETNEYLEDDLQLNDEQNDLLNGLHDEKRSLFRRMYKQSNVFHNCRSDEERAANSREVLAIWDAIQRIKAQIAYFEAHGELPRPEAEGDDLPDNPVLLGKKLNSLRAQISQIQKRLEALAERPDSDTDKVRLIQEAENNRRNKIHLRGLAEQKLKSLENG